MTLANPYKTAWNNLEALKGEQLFLATPRQRSEVAETLLFMALPVSFFLTLFCGAAGPLSMSTMKSLAWNTQWAAQMMSSVLCEPF